MNRNVILDTLPESVEINGRVYPIDSDFRTIIKLESCILNASLDGKQKVSTVLSTFYPHGVPSDLNEATKAFMDIYKVGVTDKAKPPPKARKNGDIELRQPRIYDYDYDASYIFGAFLSTYGIDLNSVEFLHWWKFHALFTSLPNNCKIVEIMGYRATDLGKIKDKHERDRIARLKAIYALPDESTPEQKVAMAGAVFGGMM